MPNEQLQLHLVRLALRELGNRAYSKDIVMWIGKRYARTRVGLKKTRYLLHQCEDVESIKEPKDIIFWYIEPKMKIGDIIRLGIKILGSRDAFADELGGSRSRLIEWIKQSTNPNEDSLKALDGFAKRYDLPTILEAEKTNFSEIRDFNGEQP